MNRGEIKDRIASAINDDRDSPVFVTDAQLNTLVDEALQILAEDSRAIRRTASLPVRAGMQFVYTPSIAADIMVPYRIWEQTTQRRLIATTMAEMDGYQTRWWRTTGTAEFWFPISWDLFGIYPMPASAGGILHVDYIAWPRDLMDDSDEPELPLASQDAIMLWATYQALLKKWDSNTAMEVFKAFQAHQALAAGRSGINKISSRIFQRMQQPHIGYPSNIDIQGE